MSRLLSSITGALGQLFGNFLPNWEDPAPVPPEATEPPEPEEELEPESDGESDYETADKGDVSSESESESESNKIIFRRIEDPALKRIVEIRRIFNQSLCVDYLAIIPENYPY
jgi:hypothetical protein